MRHTSTAKRSKAGRSAPPARSIRRRPSASAVPATTAPSLLPISRVYHPPASNDRLQQLVPGATLGGVARGTGLNVEYVSRIFNLKRRPSLRTAERIADYLQIPLGQLVEALKTSANAVV